MEPWGGFFVIINAKKWCLKLQKCNFKIFKCNAKYAFDNIWATHIFSKENFSLFHHFWIIYQTHRQNSGDLFSKGGGLFVRGGEMVSHGDSTVKWAKIWASDNHVETSVDSQWVTWSNTKNRKKWTWLINLH